MAQCVFDKCGNQRKKNNKVSFFSFPKDQKLLQKWINFVNEHNPTKLTEDQLDREKMKICHMHFERRQVVIKSNNDRNLIRSAVPCCPPGVVDKAHVPRPPRNKKSKKGSEPNSPNLKNGESDVDNAQNKKSSMDGPPLYHTINGYVVDLRIAALQETFRLPNGKLIQVRRQPKKNSDAEQATPPTKPAAQPKFKQSSEANHTAVPVTTTPTVQKDAQETTDQPSLPKPQASKTYTNRRSQGQAPNHPPSRTVPTHTPNEIVIYPPSLTALQLLAHKTHPDTPFGIQLKNFENQVLHVTQISLHVLSKLNNLLNSNPYKTAADSRDIKYLYHSVGYILEHTLNRLNGVEDNCVENIHNMGFTELYDLGPFQHKQANKTSTEVPSAEKPDKTAEPSRTGEAFSAANAGAQEEDDDDDCEIIEQRTDIIEVESDDESEDESSKKEGQAESDSAPTPRGPRQLRICSDTESIENEENSRGSERPASVIHQNKEDGKLPMIRSISSQESRINALPSSINRTTEIEVVMKEVEETTIVHNFYYEAYSDNEEGFQVTQDEIETMEVEEDDDSGERKENEEETEELIEIIEGDVDLELEDGQEYKVIEVIDGDIDTW